MSRSGDAEWNRVIEVRRQLAAEGVEFRTYREPTEILPSIRITGPVERRHAEKNYPSIVDVKIDGEWVEDVVPGEGIHPTNIAQS